MKLILTFIAACLTVTAWTQSVKGDTYGAGVTAKKYIGFEDLMSQLEAQDTVVTTLRATVSEVCQAKGCWMTLHGKAADQQVMVRFKDYGFFVPKDLSGRAVVVEGQAYKTIVPVDELLHYAEDAGKSKEEIAKITEPEESFAFLATGVVVLKDK